MSKKTETIVNGLRDDFDKVVEGLPQEEYLDVLENFISLLEGYEDCAKDEMKEDEDI